MLKANYFCHDTDLRNNRKILALRKAFGSDGYAAWCMLLECLSREESHTIQLDDVQTTLLAADFGFDTETFEKILALMERVRLITRDGDTIESPALTERFAIMDTKIAEISEKRREAGKKGGGNPTFRKGHPNPYYAAENINNCLSQDKQDINNCLSQDKQDINRDKQSKSKRKSKSKSKRVEKEESKDSKKEDLQSSMSASADSLSASVLTAKDFQTEWNKAKEQYGSNISAVKLMTDRRKAALANRVREFGAAALREAISKTMTSDFLNGRNTRNFRATPDWFLNPNNLPKILEGNYDNATNHKQTEYHNAAASTYQHTRSESDNDAFRAAAYEHLKGKIGH